MTKVDEIHERIARGERVHPRELSQAQAADELAQLQADAASAAAAEGDEPARQATRKAILEELDRDQAVFLAAVLDAFDKSLEAVATLTALVAAREHLFQAARGRCAHELEIYTGELHDPTPFNTRELVAEVATRACQIVGASEAQRAFERFATMYSPPSVRIRAAVRRQTEVSGDAE